MWFDLATFQFFRGLEQKISLNKTHPHSLCVCVISSKRFDIREGKYQLKVGPERVPQVEKVCPKFILRERKGSLTT